MRAFGSHQCGPGLNPGVQAIYGLSLLLALSLAPRGFSSGTPVFPCPQKPTLNSNSIWNARTRLNEFIKTPKYFAVFVSVLGHFRVPPGFCIKTRLSAQSCYGNDFFILMQIKLIFTRKVVHLTSFWKWGFLELGRGLLQITNLYHSTFEVIYQTWDAVFHLVMKHCVECLIFLLKQNHFWRRN